MESETHLYLDYLCSLKKLVSYCSVVYTVCKLLLLLLLFTKKYILKGRCQQGSMVYEPLNSPHKNRTTIYNSKTKPLGEYLAQNHVTWSHELHLQTMGRNACAQLVKGVINALLWTLLGQGRVQGAPGKTFRSIKEYLQRNRDITNFYDCLILIFFPSVFLLWILKSTLKS